MEIKDKGYSCPKCGGVAPIEIIEARKANPSNSTPIYVVDGVQREDRRVYRRCPECGNNEAFYWSHQISGEHAGVKQERTIEQFKCTKCLHIWGESP
jgi:DNA-directed RNA polymerase subunit M/transcription elongation factor TFIIS